MLSKLFGAATADKRTEDDDAFLRSALILEGGSSQSQIDYERDDEYKKFDGEVMGQTNDKEEDTYRKSIYTLKRVLFIGCFFLVCQSIGAYLCGSIAIATDCVHLFSDLVGFLMSMTSLMLTRRKCSTAYSFGWQRSEILGTIVSLLFLLVMTFWLVIEAFKRIFMDYEIDGEIMLITAVCSLIFNIIMITVLEPEEHEEESQSSNSGSTSQEQIQYGDKANAADQARLAIEKEKSKNINIESAYLHILGDTLMSVSVCIAGTVIYFYPTAQYPWSKYVDPACTFIFSLIVLNTCRNTLGGCIHILMEGSPQAIDSDALKTDLESMFDRKNEKEAVPKNSIQIDNLHVWSLSRGQHVVSVQIKCRGNPMGVFKRAKQVCKSYGIDNSTIQVVDLNDSDVMEEI